MAKVVFQDEQGQYLNRYQLVPVDGQPNVYDLVRLANITQQGTPIGADNLNQLLQVADGIPIQSLACTKSTTIYALTGLSTTSGKVPVMFSVPTAYAAGDTVTIDGVAYTLKTTDSTALTAGAWAVGAQIPGVADIDNKILYVRPSAPVGAITGATLGGSAITVSGQKIQLPAYPVVPGSLPANGGTSTYAGYSSHAAGSGTAGLKNNTASASMPSGGSDGDGWDYTGS